MSYQQHEDDDEALFHQQQQLTQLDEHPHNDILLPTVNQQQQLNSSAVVEHNNQDEESDLGQNYYQFQKSPKWWSPVTNKRIFGYLVAIVCCLSIVLLLFFSTWITYRALTRSRAAKKTEARKNWLQKTVFLLSIDGFRYDYLQQFAQQTTNIQLLAKNGEIGRASCRERVL